MGFKFEIPAKDKDGGTSKASTKSSEKQTVAIDGLTKAIAIGNAINSTLSSVTSGLAQLFEPLIRVLSALFVVIFLPLLPLLTKLTNAVADFTSKVADYGGGLTGLVKAIMDEFDTEFLGLAAILVGIAIVSFGAGTVGWPIIMAGALAFYSDEIATNMIDTFGSWWTMVLTSVTSGIIIAILAMTIGWPAAILAILVGVFIAVSTKIDGMFTAWIDSFVMAWDSFIEAWSKWLDSWKEIWNDFKTATWNAIKGIGQWIADAVKNALKMVSAPIRTGAKLIASPFKLAKDLSERFFGGTKQDFIQRPGQSAVSFSPQDTIIGIKDTSSLGGSTTININNPVVRSDADLRTLTDMISKRLQMSGNRGFSSR